MYESITDFITHQNVNIMYSWYMYKFPHVFFALKQLSRWCGMLLHEVCEDSSAHDQFNGRRSFILKDLASWGLYRIKRMNSADSSSTKLLGIYLRAQEAEADPGGGGGGGGGGGAEGAIAPPFP